MALDLARTVTQIEDMSRALSSRRGEAELRVGRALEALARIDPDEYENLRQRRGSEASGPMPELLEPPTSRHTPPQVPPDFTVAAADGSHIDVDRHMAARCFLINTGLAILTYGYRPDALLTSQPTLYAADDELVISDPGSYRQQPIEDAVLGAKRTVEEMRALVKAVKQLPPDLPTLALVDGSLIMLGLVGALNQDFVLRELVEEGFVRALEELEEMARSRALAVAGYVSLPGSAEVVSGIRAATCPYELEGGSYRCSFYGPGREPCDSCVGGVRDRDIFARTLEPGERSAMFATGSTAVEQYYMGTGVAFFYVHAGEEIGRVEVPSWVADRPDLLDLVHALVIDQCARGRGYPVALMEAHEQAVVTGADRRYFGEMVNGALQRGGLPVFTSEKARSKSLRWL